MTKVATPAPRGYVSVSEAAEKLGVQVQVVYNLIYGRSLEHVRQEGRIWIPLEAVGERLHNRAVINSEHCITVLEVADFFGVHMRTVLEWHRLRHLVARKVSGRLCFSLAEVVAFVPPYIGVGTGRVPEHRASRTIRGEYYPPPAP